MSLRKFSGRAVGRRVALFSSNVRLREASDSCYHARIDGVEVDIFGALPTQGVDTLQMRVISEGPVIDDMRIGSIPDLLATKLDVIQYRPKLRDYMDLAAIDQMTPHSLEDGITY